MAICAVDEGIITLPPLVSHTSQVGVPLLAVLAHYQTVIVRICCEEVLWVVVGVHNDLAESIVHSRIVASLADQVLQEGVQELQSVTLLDLQDAVDHLRYGFAQTRLHYMSRSVYDSCFDR